MEGEVAGPGIQARGGGAFGQSGIAADFHRAAQSFGALGRYAVGDHIHQTANGAIAVKQRRWPFQDLNLVGCQAFDTDGVVRG